MKTEQVVSFIDEGATPQDRADIFAALMDALSKNGREDYEPMLDAVKMNLDVGQRGEVAGWLSDMAEALDE